MEIQIFSFLLLLVSVLTGLVTEAVKNMLAERGQKTRPNTTAGVVALVLSLLIGVGWAFYTGATWTVQLVLALVALVLLSWLCAMVGYDKVVQTLAQLRGGGKRWG